MIGRGLLVTTVLALALPGAPRAQGLGDAAAREREKRAKEDKETTAPVYTNDDLEQGRPPGWEPTQESSSSAPASTPSPARSPVSAPLPDPQAALRPQIEAVRQAQAEVSQLEVQIRETGQRLNPMSVDYIYGPSGSNDPNEELRLRQELSELEQQLGEARQELARANQDLANARSGGGGDSGGGAEPIGPQ